MPSDFFPAPARPVAEIVSPGRTSGASRDSAGEADEVIRLLGIGEGRRVADIGAGNGYYVDHLSRAVGRTGVVYAEEITPSALEALRRKVDSGSLSNVRVIQGAPHDPRLPSGSVDVALLVRMYHEVREPYALLYNLLPSLSPRAVVAVLDFDRSTRQHGTPLSVLTCEMNALGFTRDTVYTILSDAYLAVFAPPPRALPADSLASSVRARPCTVRRR